LDLKKEIRKERRGAKMGGLNGKRGENEYKMKHGRLARGRGKTRTLSKGGPKSEKFLFSKTKLTSRHEDEGEGQLGASEGKAQFT